MLKRAIDESFKSHLIIYECFGFLRGCSELHILSKITTVLFGSIYTSNKKEHLYLLIIFSDGFRCFNPCVIVGFIILGSDHIREEDDSGSGLLEYTLVPFQPDLQLIRGIQLDKNGVISGSFKLIVNVSLVMLLGFVVNPNNKVGYYGR